MNNLWLSDFLKILLKCITDNNKDDVKKLQEKYAEIIAEGKGDKLLEFIHREYGDEPDMELVIFALVGVESAERKIYIERLKERLALVEGDERAWYEQLNLVEQIYRNMFCIGENDFELSWHWNHLLLDRVKTALGASYTNIPNDERNKDIVVIVASQLLGGSHEPTRLILDIARIVTKYLNKQVLLFVPVIVGDCELLRRANMLTQYSYVYAYDKNLNGRCTVTYRDVDICIYQILISDSNKSEMKEALDYIYSLKPAVVWNIGASYVYAGIMKDFTSYIHMNCTNQYPPVMADLILDYFKAPSEEEKTNRIFLEEHGIKVKEINLPYAHIKPTEIVHKGQYGISEDTFCLGIVGNRLEAECTDTFCSVMGEIIKEGNMCLVVYGEATQTLQDRIHKYIDNDKVLFMGYQKELINTLQIIDIFVNPPRLGGGGGGVMAMLLGKPVITLPGCDVAAGAGKEFVVESLSEFPNIIKRYGTDHDFYERQSMLAKQIILNRQVRDEDCAAEIKTIFDNLR